MRRLLLILLICNVGFTHGQQLEAFLMAKDRPADYEYLSAPDSLGNRTELKTAVRQSLAKTQTNNIKLPYPVIFIHGLNSNAETWIGTTFSFMTPQYGLVNGGRFDYCLNFDGNNTVANVNAYPTVGADIALFNGTWIAGDFYYVNFDVGIDGAFGPGPLAANQVLSNQSAIAKQGRALRDAIARVLQLTGRDKVILMGHSMGGLAAREYLQNPINWQPDGQAHVAKLATTGTPHAGSNATSFGLVSSNTEGQSEAIRDLRRTYYYTGNYGVYLFGGPESLPFMDDQLCCYFFNSDVNCNGSTQTNVVGLNQKNLYTNLDYSCIIGECSGCVGTTNPGDGIVWDICADLNTLYPNATTNLFYYYASAAVEIHTDLPSQFYQNMQGLDEPEYFSLAYRVGFDSTYTAFMTVPAATDPNSPYDADVFKFNVPATSTVNISVNNIIVALNFTVNVVNSSNQVVGTAVHASGSTQSISFNTPLNAGDYYLQVYAIPTASSYQVPYNFTLHTTATVGIQDLQVFEKIKIYPNPTNSILNIIDDQNQLQNSMIEIKNYLGQTVYSNAFTSQINLSDFSAGIYFLTIRNGTSQRTIKVVKN